MNLMQKHQKKCADCAPTAQPKKVMGTSKQDMKGLGLATELERQTKLIQTDALLLKSIMSHEQRDKEKALLIPKYESYLDSYLSQEKRHKNPVLVQVMVWAFDSKQIDLALNLAKYALDINDDLPEGYKSNIQEWVLDTLHDYLEEEYKAGRTSEPYLSDTIQFLVDLDTFDQIKSKFHKLAGHYAYDSEEWQKTVDHYLLAEKFSSKAQVKTKREHAEKQLEKLAEANETKTNEAGAS